MLAGVLEIVRYRELVRNLIRRDLKRRYKGSVLGFFWYLVNPLLIMLILWFVFSKIIMRFSAIGPDEYLIYLLTALLSWNLFSQAILNASTNLATSGSLIRKVYVPKAVFPLASVGGSLINFLFSLIPLFLLILLVRRPIGWSILFLPVGVLLLLSFSTGMALIISGLNVFFRDVHHIAEVLLIAGFYLTPIIWPKGEGFPSVQWNPMSRLIDCIRDPIHYGVVPPVATVLWAAACGFGALALGILVFRRLESRFIYHL